HGLSLAVMEVPRSLRAPAGMPFMLLYRTVLENCKTVEEAITLLRQTARQSSNNLMLMDASGDRAVAELTPGKVTVRRAPATAALVSTNHQRGGDLDSPDRCNRFDFLHDASSRQFGRLSEASVEEMLAGAAQGDFTFQSMVFEPSTRILYLALGAGAPNHGFARLDLNPLFH
ncbi:MAG TPA: carcinine hydrolase/isopenicillin-N N-acyltransferase family protein, partial [Methylomirabilota bacterium]|nr:carcinine hydrolase/isopenicillin-N N-acyltransferase family protein [Methylomirabilota bacterium]